MVGRYGTDDLFDEYDTNGDGVIDPEEWLRGTAGDEEDDRYEDLYEDPYMDPLNVWGGDAPGADDCDDDDCEEEEEEEEEPVAPPGSYGNLWAPHGEQLGNYIKTVHGYEMEASYPCFLK